MTSSLHRYPSHKPSGVGWLSDVPAHWDVRRLKTAAANVVNLTRESTNSGISLALENVESWTGRYTPAGAGIAFESQGKRFKADDVLFGKLRPYLAKVTRPDQGGVCVGEFLVLRPSDASMSPEYLEQLLRSKPVIDAIDGSTFGTKMPRADWQFIGGMPIPIPPLPEQQAIGRYLDHVDRRIQLYVSAKRRLVALLKEERQAIVTQAVTRGLDLDVQLRPSGVEWLGDVPEHWDVRRLRAAVENVVDFTRTLAPDEIYVALENVESWTGRYTASSENGFESQVKRFRADDVLFGKLRPYLAKVACPRENGVCVGEFLVLRPRDVSVSPQYLENVLRSKPVIDTVDASTFGAKMPRADWLFIGGMRIPVPPLTEQAAIVARVADATADIDTAIARTRQQIELMEEYRTRLVADVVTGKLDVRDAAERLPHQEAGDDWPEDSPTADFLNDDDEIPKGPAGLTIESEVTA